MVSLQQSLKSETFSRIELDLSYNFLFTLKVLKCLFVFYTTAIVLEFGFVFTWMLGNGLPSHIIVLCEKKNKGNFSALIAVLPNSSVTSIIICTAVWHHLDDSFSALGYHVAWTLVTASGNYFSPQHQYYYLNVKPLLFFLLMLQWTVNLFTCIKNLNHCNHPHFELIPCWC